MTDKMNNTIISKKNQLINLVQEIVDDYTSGNEDQIQKTCELNLELRKMSDIIREQERHSKEMTQEHINKELIIQKQKKQLYEYEELIKKLEDKVVLLNDAKEEENKFNIVRIQAKDIEDKDREIDRLNKKIVYLKESNKGVNKTIDIVLQKIEVVDEVNEIKVEEEVPEEVIEVTEEVNEIKVEEVTEEEVTEEEVAEEEVTEEVTEEEVTEEEVTEEEVTEEEVAEEEEVIQFTYRNKVYCYVDGSNQDYIAYHYLSDGTKGDIAGKWGQTKTGKIKLLKK